MSDRNENASVNRQTHGHIEGQQNNTRPLNDNDGQRRSENHNQPMSSMLNESEEQKRGAAYQQKDEGEVQQEERMP